LPGAVLISDSHGRITTANPEVYRLFGYDRQELIGGSIESLIPERLRRRHEQFRWQYTMRPQVRRMGVGRDLVGLRKDGTEFPIELSLTPIYLGREMIVMSVIVDITGRKSVERMKDDFVSTVSHELRTPMTSIAGSLGLLAGGAAGTMPEQAKRLLSIAHENCQRLVRLVNDILDIQKLEAGLVTCDLQRIEVCALIERTLEGIRAFADGFGVRLMIEPQATAAEVQADADRLTQAVTNLVSNAIKFSPRGQAVVVGVARRHGRVVISVRDYGSGIPAEFRSRIFQKFAQANGTGSRPKGGTGLGLSIARQIILQLGGTVGFDDAPGGGTVFVIDLPEWSESASAPEPPKPDVTALK